jgi:ADP-ribose pyrophosphatase YjhB (NUDIX family)
MKDALKLAKAVESYGKPVREEAIIPPTAFATPKDSNRAGEVAMVLRQDDGSIWLHTKEFYPEGVYRIPTGKIEDGETLVEALWRELGEETNLEVDDPKFLAVIHYTIDGKEIPFVSYVFLFTVTGGTVSPIPEEQITDWVAVPVERLSDVSWELNSLSEDWLGWGWFRSVLHRIVHKLITSP